MRVQSKSSHGRLLHLVLWCSLLLVGAPAASAAQQTFDSADECMEAPMDPLDPMPHTCTSTGDGRWVSSDTTTGFGDPSTGSGFGTFILVALLWSAVPLFIAASMASSRGESVGIAVALTLFLGWIGLAIVYFGQRQTGDVVRGLANVSNLAPAGAGGQVAPRGAESSSARLVELSRLREQGLVDDEEYARQRARIIDSI